MKHVIKFLVLPLISILFLRCTAADATPETETEHEIVQTESPDIKFQVDGLTGGVVRLIGVFTDQQFVVDTAIVDQNGTAILKKTNSYEQGLYYLLLPNNANFQLIISEDQTFEMHASVNNIEGTMKVTGQVDNQLLYENLRYESTYQQRFQLIGNQLNTTVKATANYENLMEQRSALMAERAAHLEGLYAQAPNSLFTSFKKAGQNPDLRFDVPESEQIYWYRQQFWDSVDFSDERLLHTSVITNKLKRYISQLTPQQPDSIIAATNYLINLLPSWKNSAYFQYFVNSISLMYEPTETTLMDAEAVYVNMVQKYFTYDHAFWTDSANIYALQLRAEEMKNSLVGQAGPNVTAPDPNGVDQSVYDLKAPYIVVYLYNPDCEHCQEQSPLLVNLYNKWQSSSSPIADVYAIAIDTDKNLWKNYIAKTNMRWTNVFDPTNQSIYKTYYVNVTPELYVLGPDRKIIAKNLKVSQVEEVIRRDQEKR